MNIFKRKVAKNVEEEIKPEPLKMRFDFRAIETDDLRIRVGLVDKVPPDDRQDRKIVVHILYHDVEYISNLPDNIRMLNTNAVGFTLTQDELVSLSACINAVVKDLRHENN